MFDLAGLQRFDHDVQMTAAGQTQTFRFFRGDAVLEKLGLALRQFAGNQFFEQVVLDTAAGERTDDVTRLIAGQQRTYRPRRRPPGRDNRCQPAGFIATEPFHDFSKYFVVDRLHARKGWPRVQPVYTSGHGSPSSMPAQRPLQIDADIDLELFCAYLWKLGIRHRVYEEQGRQVVEVADPSQSEAVREQYAAWRTGRLTLVRSDTRTGRARPLAHALSFVWQCPVLASLVLVTLVCFPATWSLDYGELSSWVRWLTFVDVTLVNGFPHYADLATTLASGQLWRLVTPIFLHFSVAHLLFNTAVIIEFGRRVERGLGGPRLLGMVLAIAVASNLAQYLSTGPGMFGGMSGVAYGLVGFVVVRGRRAPEHPLWKVSRSFVVAVVGFLVLMSTGVTELFGLHIANAAHWVGLCVGALLGLPGGNQPARESP